MKRFFSKRSSQRSQLQYFNTTLDTQIEYDSQRDNLNIIKLKTPIIGVPIIVQIFIEYFDRDDILKTEGLFRTTGSIKQVKLLKDDIETSGLINLYKDESDLLTLTSLFKLWLRELQDGVIPNEDYIKMEAAQDSLELFKIALDTLSRYHWETLRYISQFLLKLSSFSEENKMNVNNICIVFGPTLIKSDMDSLDSQVVLNDNIKNSQILELILTNFDYLFDTDSLSNLNSPTQMNLKQSFDSLSSISNDVVLNEMENLQVDNVVKKTVQSFFGSNRKKSMMMVDFYHYI
ncbi:Rho GTPase activation protein [Globomyces pollinis-pini]|nr:Rho GTPase activation protein [Globomyces pollinis-pini]